MKGVCIAAQCERHDRREDYLINTSESRDYIDSH